MSRHVLIATTAIATLILPVGSALAASFNSLSGEKPLVIAHRGASGYLPEHTLPAYELGAEMGADYVEPDIGLTSDGVTVAIHDSTLTRTTNVEDLFAPRNGSYRVSDFTYAEIQQLTVQPQDTDSYSYPGFTPTVGDNFNVPTLQEVIDFVNGYNAANGTNIGIYPELKTSSDALRESVIAQLIDGGFTSASDKVFLQSFHGSTLEAAFDLQADLGSMIPQVLLGGVRDAGVYDFYSGTTYTFDEVAGFASGIGTNLNGITQEFIDSAHAVGLQVHGYTVNGGSLAAQEPLITSLTDAGIDGFFTNFPDITRQIVDDAAATAAVPLPGAAGLLVLGLATMGGFGVRRKA